MLHFTFCKERKRHRGLGCAVTSHLHSAQRESAMEAQHAGSNREKEHSDDLSYRRI